MEEEEDEEEEAEDAEEAEESLTWPLVSSSLFPFSLLAFFFFLEDSASPLSLSLFFLSLPSSRLALLAFSCFLLSLLSLFRWRRSSTVSPSFFRFFDFFGSPLPLLSPLCFRFFLFPSAEWPLSEDEAGVKEGDGDDE